MNLSAFDLFKIGIGPSSSHTMGPMRAARDFLGRLRDEGRLDAVQEVIVRLYGSLALTGVGHGTDRAVMLGLEGVRPETADPDLTTPTIERIRAQRQIRLLGGRTIAFEEARHLQFMLLEHLPRHTNGMRFTALDARGTQLREDNYYSIGGGFIVRGSQPESTSPATDALVPYVFASAAELLRLCDDAQLEIFELVLANELTWKSRAAVRADLLEIWDVMRACIDRGLRGQGTLPGILKLPRRAPAIYRALTTAEHADPLAIMDWVSAFAMAVNEENASGGRVVTAPTNGAAGVIPAVLRYYCRFEPGADEEGIVRFLLTAAAIGMLYKRNASLSGAEMGCQGEVGVACSMAAAGLVAALRGTNRQVENAAEIGMEHHLGLTCDPVAGLVQIPCIERNAMGAIKAINAARLAMRSDGTHRVSLDQVIATMRQTGLDMSTIYKETSLGGLAVNVIEC